MSPQMKYVLARTVSYSILSSWLPERKMQPTIMRGATTLLARDCGFGSGSHPKAGWPMLWSSRLPHLPFLWCWYWIWFDIPANGKGVCWLWKEEQAWICDLPSTPSFHCHSWSLKFYSHHPHDPGTLRCTIWVLAVKLFMTSADVTWTLSAPPTRISTDWLGRLFRQSLPPTGFMVHGMEVEEWVRQQSVSNCCVLLGRQGCTCRAGDSPPPRNLPGWKVWYHIIWGMGVWYLFRKPLPN